MTVKMDQLLPYKKVKADLIPLHIWNKQTNIKGKIVQRGKTPIYSNWTKRPKNIPETLEKIKQGYNVGYRIGDDDLIIDVDKRNFKEKDSLKELCEFLGIKDLADKCPTVITGSGGFHYYLKIPKDIGIDIREVHEDYPGIEFKTKGRQVVCAGSRHPNGKYYEWDELSPELKDAPKAPQKLLKLLKRDVSPNANNATEGELSNEQLTRLLVQLPIEEFDTNDSWFPIMCAAHHATAGAGINEFLEWSLDDLKYIEDEHLIRCRWDSLGGKKNNYTVNTLYKTVLAYGGDTAIENAQEEFADFKDKPEDQEDDPTYSEDNEFDDVLGSKEVEDSYASGVALSFAQKLHPNSSDEHIVQAIRAALQAGTIEKVKALGVIQVNLKMSKGSLNEIIKQIKEQIIEDLGRVLAEKTLKLRFNKGNGLVFNSNAQFWCFNGMFWETVTKQYVERHITHVLDKMREKVEVGVKESVIVSEASAILSRITAVNKDVLRLREKPYPVINCLNGELWIKDTGEVKLKQHNPKSYLLQAINVEYSPGAECPKFDAAIRRTFSNFNDSEDMVRHYEEFMGYVLHPDKRPAHFWLMKGPGGDGKTTLMKILSKLLGDAVVPDSIERFGNGAKSDSHATTDLIGKLLIYDDDLNRKTVLPDGALKKLSEDGELQANPKGVQGFKFVKVCTPVMLCNGYPKTKDISRGFRRRAAVIPFNMAFHEKGAILDLVDEIAKTELAGVLNRALQGLQRLRNRGKFLEPESCRIARETWLNESNTVANFISQRIERTDDSRDTIKLTEAYSSYLDWCLSYNIKYVETKQDFKTSMEDMDILFGKAHANANVFRMVKLKNIEADENDWDED